MKKSSRWNAQAALTLVELILVICVLAILAVLLIPAFVSPHTPAYRIGCVMNLKQVGLAFSTWAGENNDRFPMGVSVTNGGSMEFVDSPNTFRHFQALSNLLQVPKVLICGKDASRCAATDFTKDFDNSHLSYFIGIDAVHTNSTMFLAGDRNITNQLIPRNGILSLPTSSRVGWTEKIHKTEGNLLFADGHVERMNNKRLNDALQNSRGATNRLAVP